MREKKIERERDRATVGAKERTEIHKEKARETNRKT